MFKRVYTVAMVSMLLVGLLMSAGCGSKEVAPVDPEMVKKELLGKVWVCQNLFKRPVTGDAQLTMEFLADGTVRGNGGCNDFTGTYTLDGKSLSFGPIASTKKACGPSASDQEFSYFNFLSQISKMEVDDDELELLSDEQPTSMNFTTGDGGGLLW